MLPEIKLMWTTTLRSGKYKQGRGQLRAGDEFCCLGVLCDLIDPSLWTTEQDRYCYRESADSWKGHAFTITRTVELKTRLTKQQADTLSRLNDRGGGDDYQPYSFEQIADYIENWY